eukprot:TRINITY_DN13101_c0_g1_i1.p1 TRINITY_DN13101_c0_g1~~TRINITY_DN13101_c0_g1_i1.p1  ORF type:complete len:625 (+),score=340.20 TRINITY_DN13101_c0_g1_i1:70-1944(+)
MSKSQSFSAQKEQEAGKLFVELKEAEGNAKKSLQLCDQILSIIPGDDDALGYKAHVLIENNRFNDCAKLFEEAGYKPQKKHALHFAYVNYRLNRLQAAEDALRNAKDSECKTHLRAQIQYKKENYQEAVKAYQSLREGADEDEEEVMVNLSASVICDRDLPAATKMLGMPDGDLTHDLLVNKACVFVEKEDYSRALKSLQAAEKDMKEVHLEEYDGQIDEDALRDDLATVNVQRAYIAAKQGDDETAGKILAEVLKHKPASLSTLAVGSNNYCSLLQRDVTVFDAYKRLKPLRDANFDSKLSSSQRLAIRFNTSVLMGSMGHKDQGKSLADTIAKENPASPLGPIALASILISEKKWAKAEDVLRTFLANTNDTEAKLFLAQIHLQQGKLKDMVKVLKDVDALNHQLGVVATIVGAYETQGNVEDAVQVFNDAVAHWKGKDADKVRVLTKEKGLFLMRHKEWEAAVTVLKEALKMGNDVALQAHLVSCLARTNVAEAEKLSAELDSYVVASEITPEAAEDLLAVKIREMGTATTDTKEEKKEKVKKRKPGKKPANANGEPEADRWYAMKDRASYKALTKRQAKDIKREKMEAKQKALRQAAVDRLEFAKVLKSHYDDVREKESA